MKLLQEKESDNNVIPRKAECESVYSLKPQAKHSIDILSSNYHSKKTWFGLNILKNVSA